MSAKPETGIFTFKVKLKYVKRIWRCIAIRGDQTLDDLHEAIFVAFDRYDDHLYSFYIGERLKTVGRRGRSGIEYTQPYNFEERWLPLLEFEEPPRNAAQTTIESLNLTPKQIIEYVFDFGDDWEHEIVVESIDGERQTGTYPRILNRRGDSPPQYEMVEEDKKEVDEDNQ